MACPNTQDDSGEDLARSEVLSWKNEECHARSEGGRRRVESSVIGALKLAFGVTPD